MATTHTNNPLEQFEIKTLIPLKAGDIDFSFTNSSLHMVIGLGILVLFFLAATSGRRLIPGRLQSIAEVFYEFIASMVRDTAGKDGMKFFPFVFTLFCFVLVMNFLGLMPYSFTVTSHIAVTFAMALMVILLVLIVGFSKHGLGFFRLFAPRGLPFIIYPILVPIEVISFLTRPISLSVRLFANMFAGHTMLKVFAGFVVSLGAMGGVGLGFALVPLLATAAVTALEFLVAALQAFIFAMLTCIYISDALHPDH